MNRLPMLLFTILPILFLLLTMVDEATAKCDENSDYDECANQCTAPNCPGKVLTCPLSVCQAGCKCKKGYIQLNPGRGPCVPEDKCPKQNCSKYEHWETGSNWCCPPTCQNPDIGKQCKCGPKGACICNKGYVRSEFGGPCIPIGKCPKNETCGENEHWETSSNWCCPPTCQNPDIGKVCFCGPKGACICDKEYVRSELGGPCVPIEKCPKNDTCGENEEPTDCGNVCIEPNCPGVVMGCPKNCQPGVCKCKKGYVRLIPGTEPSPCVLKEECPPSNCTGEYEFWDTGGNWCCPRTCETRDDEIMCKCTIGGRCNCIPGYIRPKDEEACIPVDQCPNDGNTCPRNEVFTMSSSWCCDSLRTCDTPNKPCNLFCTQAGGCVCAPGNIRAFEGGPCIPESKCCKKPHEVWRQCANGCEPTCKNRSPICPENCPVDGGCECDANNEFIRESENGDCIKKSACPKKKRCVH